MLLFENSAFAIHENETIKFAFPKGSFDKSFAKFLKQYPAYITDTIKIGSDAISQYKSSKNMTARFFAKSSFERKLYGDIVSTLNSSGKFKMVTKKFKDGGIYYELVRK